MGIWATKKPKVRPGDHAGPRTRGASRDDRGDFSLFDAGKGNCPDSLSTADKAEYSCMYFKVGL